MAEQTEKKHAGEYILSEGNGNISREEITVLSGQNLDVGQIVGKISASGKYKLYSNGAGDGSEVAVGILYDAVDASAGDMPGVITARLSEVASSMLTGGNAGSTVDLAALNVILR